jgi:hypothetical protein
MIVDLHIDSGDFSSAVESAETAAAFVAACSSLLLLRL